ncbi:MAG: hypothetical protein JRH20_11910 [Deltaproteobacteria bacterium]|nr:hypothetical protein [Deltaproteobacteria bacterium]
MSALLTTHARALFVTFIAVAALAAMGCTKPEGHSATITLKIDGEVHDYQTKAALVEVRRDPGTYSVYLRPADPADEKHPHVSLRTFSGNPVARLSVRYRSPSAEAAMRFECFIPGTLSDGRETLTWKKADGSARDRTQRGEADCRASIKREGKTLRFAYDAILRPATKRKKKKSMKGGVEAAPKARAIKVSGSAMVRM